ncbi:DNA-processing protein DprA [Poseidonibacter lekithochrous]|uniref:DNA-processing protein DprA n=1 Tax=Poseidonibacter lekithochrous TaxID=1904463 RepID=UPI0008FC8069|nr:DNA-processing protein DprA [Poseidonibacter lekithochrous]QKJ24311.1 DNA protecting protein DprA [Poseidonibacter lekithochrous]
MISQITYTIDELSSMKKYPKELFYIGNTKLLEKQKVSIVGTRRPNAYTKEFTHKLSQKLSQANICIVSGAAMGVDAISHKAANTDNTIAVVANGLDIRYPSINKNLIKDIESNGLMLSAYKEGEKARAYTFVLRNEIVVALGDILIVSEADIKSGSLTSVQYALDMGKKVYTLPHRLNESLGTQELVRKGLIEPIYDIDKFVNDLSPKDLNQSPIIQDEFLSFCSSSPLYDEAVLKYSDKVFEYELLGKIEIKNGKIFVL